MGQAAALLIKCSTSVLRSGATLPWPGADALRSALTTAAVTAGNAGFEVERIAAYQAISAPEIYAYLWMAATREVAGTPLPAFGGALAGMPSTVLPLQRVDQRAGASQGEDAPFHYVVEFDVEAGFRQDIDQWYDHEHIGGLAAVPGVTRAQRFYNLGGSPWSIACYDLVSLDTHDSPPWYAVRSSEWSARVRPHFVGTRRTKFARLFDVAV